MDKKQILKERLNELMQTFDVSEAELTKATNLTQTTINRLRKGISDNPTILTLLPIANYFNITIGQLYGLEPLPVKFSIDTILSKRIFLEVPLINFEQLNDIANIIPKLNRNNWSDWVYTNAPIASSLAFSLDINKTPFTLTFAKNTIIIVEPEYQPTQYCQTIVELEQDEGPIVCRYIINGSNGYLSPMIKEDNRFVRFDRISKYIGTLINLQTNLIDDES